MIAAACFLVTAKGRLLPASIPFRFFGAACVCQVLAWAAMLAGAEALPAFAGGLGLPLSLTGAFATMGLVAVGISLPNSPGLVGQFQWLTMLGVSLDLGSGILDGKSRGVFSGRIVVKPDAQKTQAYQMNSNLLLSDDAIVDTKPQLEIFADDVKCGHGGTVGQLDEAALFYLRQRGLSEAEAQALLVWAFASEMVGKIEVAGLRERARLFVAARLPAGAAILEAA